MQYDFRSHVSKDHFLSGFRREPKYESDIKYWHAEKSIYEQKLTLAPFYGAGAGLLLLSSAALTSSNSELIGMILPSAWFFLFSLMAMFVAGAYYVLSSTVYESSLIGRRNAVTEFMNFYDKLQKHDSIKDNIAIKKHWEKADVVIINVNEAIDIANRHDEHGDKMISLARIFAVLGIVLFLLGLLSPLITVSVNYKFGFFFL